MINRYIYAVTRELPEKSRKDIASELKTLIDDMMDATNSDLSKEEKIDKVLRELGNPKELANQYRGKARYLIGPNYFDKYIFVIKIVILSIFIGISIASGLGAIFSIESIPEMLGGYISALFSAILQGVAWVTGIFALLEYNEAFVETGMKQDVWEPSQLPTLPGEKALISRGNSIFSIIITTILLQLFFFSPEIIGIYYKVSGSELGFIQLFNLDEITAFKVIIFAIFTINILIELIKIIKGRWTTKIAIIITMLNVISAALFIYTITNMNIWNSDIVQKFGQYLPISFERMLLITIVVIVIVAISESVSVLYKGIKYGEK